MHVDIAFTPCPNDTFVFHALVHGLIDTSPLVFTPVMRDVEALNRDAFHSRYGVTKLSVHAVLKLDDRYEILSSGAAIGRGCGPLVVSCKPGIRLDEARIAVPGGHTTAALLLKLWNPGLRTVAVLRYDEILPAVAGGAFDAGLIIHESRFVYPEYGCEQVVDLGRWWEDETGLPVPLGCMAVRRDLSGSKGRIEELVRESIRHAQADPCATMEYVRSHAQETRQDVIDSHISLYVNEYSIDMGEEGRRAIEVLRDRARLKGVL